MRLPPALLAHPLESLIAAGLLLTLLLGAPDGSAQKAQSNQSVSPCARVLCTAGNPAH